MNSKTTAAISITILFQPLLTIAAVVDNNGSAPPPLREIIARGPHQRTWQTVRQVQVDDQTILTTNTYQELANGICYPGPNGEYLDSQEVISIANGYGVATQGLHQVIFSPSITDSPTVDYNALGNRFQSRLLGLAYFDRASGKSAMVSLTQQSIGTVDSNTVTYASAFTNGISADVVYVYRRGSFEQNILLRAQLPSPSLFEIDPRTCRIQVWTEMLDAPEPDATTTNYIYQEADPTLRQSYAEPDFKDQFLSWTTMHIPRGKCFVLDSEAIRQAGIDVDQEIPVGKEWSRAVDPDTGQARLFLIESVEFALIKPLLDTLPTADITNRQNQNRNLATVKAQPALGRKKFLASFPKPPKAHKSTASLQTARSTPIAPIPLRTAKAGKMPAPLLGQAQNVKRGVNIDYTTVLTRTNFTFASDTNYYVSSSVTLSGTNTLESCIIKFSKNNAQISISGSGATLLCSTALGRPAILTSEDDQTVGETIGENGSPSGYYGVNYLYFDAGSSGVLSSMSNLRIMYAASGLGYNNSASGTGQLISHCQFYNCSNAVNANVSADVILRNALAVGCLHFINGFTTARGENVTVSGTTWLTNGGATLWLTNAILYNITHADYAGGANNASPSSNPFQTVIGGAYYLADGSSYRNGGTTNINAALAADLQQRTTYPPLVISSTITNDTVLNPQAGRDTDIPDQGYHYDPLDWILSASIAITNATLTLQNSVAVGVSGTVGLKMRTGSKLASTGSPTVPVRLLRLESIQETGGTNTTKTALFADDLVNGTQPEARLRFTEMAILPNGGKQFSGGGQMAVLAAQDCRFLAGGLNLSANGASTRALTLTNSLFERTANTFGTGSDPLQLYARNDLFSKGAITFKPVGTNTWTWYDNVFDNTTITTNSNTFTNNYNGYLGVSEFPAHGTNDVVTSLTWQVWTLGNYYQPTNSAFTNSGSQTADLACLYHYCIFTNQIKEATNKVSIGLHYVALDANGNPQDYDTDGIPDYLEDLNGNGSVDSGETYWKDAVDWGLRVLITRPRNNSIIP